MRSDRSFKEFLSSAAPKGKAIIILILGVLMIIFGAILSKKDKATETANAENEEIAELCSKIDGVGRCRVYITYEEEGGRVYSVAVLCDGAEDVETRRDIVELFSSLYGIGANRISVLKIR